MPTYNLAQPTESDALAAMVRVFGAKAGPEKWTRACDDAELRVNRITTLSQLGLVAAALARQGGAEASVARSIEIRIHTYRRVAAAASPASVTS